MTPSHPPAESEKSHRATSGISEGADHQSCSVSMDHFGSRRINRTAVCITNKFFNMKPHHKVSWKHPQSKHTAPQPDNPDHCVVRLVFDGADSHNGTNNVLRSVDLNAWKAVASNTRRRFSAWRDSQPGSLGWKLTRTKKDLKPDRQNRVSLYL